jgi:hypothetical protein
LFASVLPAASQGQLQVLVHRDVSRHQRVRSQTQEITDEERQLRQPGPFRE